MALPPVGVTLTAQDANAFEAALKSANSTIASFGQAATAVTSSVNSAFGGLASAASNILAPVTSIFDKIFNQVFRVLVRQAVREVENFIGSIAEAAIKGSDLETSISRLGVSLDSVAKSAFAPFVDQLGGMVANAAPAFLGVVQAAESYLGGLGQSALAWGSNLVTQFAQGMWDGVGAILSVLTDIANLISYWLSPGSPPRLLPDIDKWGTAAANEFFGGWGKADFSIFTDLSGTITNLIRSIPLPKGDQVGVVPSILGAREGIAAAVEELKTAGAISVETMNRITAAVGTSDDSVRAYLESMVRLQSASDTVKAAQDELNAATERYQSLLKPIDAQLAGITEEQQQLADEQKKSLLQLVLKDPGSSAAQKRQAQLEIERIDAEKRRRLLLAEQKTVVEGAKDKLDAAKKAEAAAQDEFDARKAFLLAQTETNNLLKEQLRLIESLNKAGGAGPKPAGGGGKPAISPFAIKPFSLEDFVPPDIQQKWEAFVNALRATWDKILDIFQPAIDVWNQQVLPAWNHLVKAFESSVPDIESAIAEMVAFIVVELGTVLTGVFSNVAISLDTLAHIWEAHHSTMLSVVVNTFKIIFTTVSVTLLLISGLVAVVLNQISGFLDAWSLLFTRGWQAAWDQVKLTFYDSGQIILDTLAKALDAILAIVGQDTETFIKNWEGVWNNAHIIVMHYIDLIRDGITEWTAAIGANIREELGKVQAFWSGTWDLMAQALDRPVTVVSNLFRDLRELWQWLQDHVFNIQLPNIPGINGPNSSVNNQVNGPSSAGAGSSIVYGGSSITTGGYTYAPTYVSPAPPPAHGFATMQALFG